MERIITKNQGYEQNEKTLKMQNSSATGKTTTRVLMQRSKSKVEIFLKALDVKRQPGQ